jgi:2-polyprenyl-3-methyl-5-hydroxy-6-metoxy-1,4-benzoquinol methylase
VRPSRYFLPDGYRENKATETFEQQPGDYWSPWRIRDAQLYQYHVYRYARRLASRMRARSVVDVGCGYPIKLWQMFGAAGMEIVGVDQPTLREVVQRQFPALRFQGVDLAKHDLAVVLKQQFDLVICSDVIEHVDHPEKLVGNLVAISHADTRLIISTPERDVERGRGCNYSPKPEHVREWNKAEFAALLGHLGLRVEDHLLLPKKRRSIRRPFERITESCQAAVCQVS